MTATPAERQAKRRALKAARGATHLVDVYGDPARGFAGGYLP